MNGYRRQIVLESAGDGAFASIRQKDRLTIGGGVQFQDDAFANTTNTAYVPSFWKFDAMAAYKVTKNSTLQLNVYNIGDAMYYAQYYAGHAVPASGRYAALSYRIRFEPEPAVIPAKIVK